MTQFYEQVALTWAHDSIHFRCVTVTFMKWLIIDGYKVHDVHISQVCTVVISSCLFSSFIFLPLRNTTNATYRKDLLTLPRHLSLSWFYSFTVLQFMIKMYNKNVLKFFQTFVYIYKQSMPLYLFTGH